MIRFETTMGNLDIELFHDDAPLTVDNFLQYVRSGFQRPPTADWPQQWELLINGFFREAVSQPLPGQASSFLS